MQLPARETWNEDAKLRIGTSGWAYRHWLGRFYPRRSLPSAQHLAHFARRFPTVEVNSTYYQLPSEDTFRAWRDATPPGFRFSVKSPGIVTHEKRLVDAWEDVSAFLKRCRLLRDRLGVHLFQFPPSFKADLPLMRDFLDRLPPGARYAFELRHRSWFERDVRDMLSYHGVGWVVHDFNRKGSPLWATAPFVYLRLHGATGRYRGAYDPATLLQWAEQVRAWLAEGREVWCYLNNDERGKSLQDALWLAEQLGSTAATAPERPAAGSARPSSKA